MKRLISILLTLALCLAMCACGENETSANQPVQQGNTPGSNTTEEKEDGIPAVDTAKILREGTCGGATTYKLYDNGVLIISGNGSFDGDDGFNAYKDYIEYVCVEDGITDVGIKAFSNMTNITMVQLPKTLKTIGESAFVGCYFLKSVDLPEGLVSIGAEAFNRCDLQTLTLPTTISAIEERTFANNEDLEILIIPGNVKTIGGNAFAGCDSLETVILCDGVETIETGAVVFEGTRKMAIPNSVTSIGKENIDYRTKVYCNEGSFAAGEFADEADVIVGYNGFVKNYELP